MTILTRDKVTTIHEKVLGADPNGVIAVSCVTEVFETTVELFGRVEQLEAQAALMRDALEFNLTGAKHESCKFGPDDPDETWHCCDWSETVQKIEDALKVDAGAELLKKLQSLQVLAEYAKEWRVLMVDKQPLAESESDKQKRHKQNTRVNLELAKAVDVYCAGLNP